MFRGKAIVYTLIPESCVLPSVCTIFPDENANIVNTQKNRFEIYTDATFYRKKIVRLTIYGHWPIENFGASSFGCD